MRGKGLFAGFIFVIILGADLGWAYLVQAPSNTAETAIISIAAFLVAWLISSVLKIARPLDKAT